MDDTNLILRMDRNRHKWNKMVSIAVSCPDECRRILLCSQAALFAIHNPCGVFYSKEIEECLCEISQAHHVPLEMEPLNGQVLHVLTRAYETGGHTRICERWMDASPNEERHSVILLNQGDFPVPSRMESLTAAKGGQILSLTLDNPLHTALQLRKIASGYARIILYTHMHDVLPLLAFGTQDFERPVIYYNHADHMFWLGGKISDRVVNFRTMSSRQNPLWRGIDRNVTMPLPTGEFTLRQRNHERATITKKSLGFLEGSRVIITIASAYKFYPFAGLDFIKTVENILQREPLAAFLIIGPHKNDKLWRDICSRYPDRLKVIGEVAHSNLDTYLEIADIALESFPLGSPTALIDAVRYNIPCLTLRTPPNNYDAFEEAGILCDTQDDLVMRLCSYIHNPPVENKLFSLLQRDSSPQAIRKFIENISDILPPLHVIYSFPIQQGYTLTDFEKFLLEQNFSREGDFLQFSKSMIREILFLITSQFGWLFIHNRWFYRVCRKRLLM